MKRKIGYDEIVYRLYFKYAFISNATLGFSSVHISMRDYSFSYRKIYFKENVHEFLKLNSRFRRVSGC